MLESSATHPTRCAVVVQEGTYLSTVKTIAPDGPVPQGSMVVAALEIGESPAAVRCRRSCRLPSAFTCDSATAFECGIACDREPECA